MTAGGGCVAGLFSLPREALALTGFDLFADELIARTHPFIIINH